MKLHPEITDEFVGALSLSPANQSMAYRAAREIALAETRELLKSIGVDSDAALVAECNRLLPAVDRAQNELARLLHAKQPSARAIEQKSTEHEQLYVRLRSIRAALEL